MNMCRFPIYFILLQSLVRFSSFLTLQAQDGTSFEERKTNQHAVNTSEASFWQDYAKRHSIELSRASVYEQEDPYLSEQERTYQRNGLYERIEKSFAEDVDDDDDDESDVESDDDSLSMAEDEGELGDEEEDYEDESEDD